MSNRSTTNVVMKSHPMSYDISPHLKGRNHENDSNVSSPETSTMALPSCFHNLDTDTRAKARVKKPYYVPSHGSDESFAYMGSTSHGGTRANVSLSEGLTKELNETVTPPNTTGTSRASHLQGKHVVGKAARVMNRYLPQTDPLDAAQQQQQQQQKHGTERTVPLSSLAAAVLPSASHRNSLGYGTQYSMITKRSQVRQPQIQRTATTMPVTKATGNYKDALKFHTEDQRKKFNTPTSNDNATYHSDSLSSSLVEDDDNHCSSKKTTCSSSGNSSSVFGSTSRNDHRYFNDLLTSSTPQHRSRTSSSDSSIVAEIIEIDKAHYLDENEESVSKTPNSTDRSHTEEHSYNNHHQKNTHHLNNKKNNQFKKRPLGAKEPRKEKGLNTFSKVNGVKDSTQRPSKKKKVTAIVPGKSLSKSQSYSSQSSMDNDISSYGNNIRDSSIHQQIPRKNKITNSRSETSANINSNRHNKKWDNDHNFEDNGWRASNESAETSRSTEGKSNGIHSKRFHSTTNREQHKPSILERVMDTGKAVIDTGKAMVSKGTKTLSNMFPSLSPSADHRPVTRSSARKNQKKNDVVVIDDSDDDIQEIVEDTIFDEDSARKALSSVNHSSTDRTPSQEHSVQQTIPRKRLGDRFYFSLVQIAIGEKIFSHNCSMQFQTGTQRPFIHLSFSDSATDALATKNIEIPLTYDSIQEMAYSLQVGDDSDNNNIPYLAMRLVLPQNRGHHRGTNTYLEEMMGCGQFQKLSELCENFIVCEIRDELDFKEKLPIILQNSDFLKVLLTEDANIRSADKALLYTSVLIKKNELDKKARLESSQSPNMATGRTRSGSSKTLTVKEKHRILLVYPFVGGTRIEKVAQELDYYTRSFPYLDEEDNDISSEKLLEIQKEAASGRTHILTITVEDRERLEPGEFLNDTLIDFWMRWISRKEPFSKSCVHFFTSHFYTTLRVEGVNAVSSWTSKKGIDIFSKSIIFLPINQTLHWSLCAIMNPGTIQKVVDVSGESSVDHAVPCIIFLDSLKAHQKATVAKHVRIWLNHEYKKKFGGDADIFTTESIKVYAPKVPYQNNSWDCGVFVCQYANAIYQQRHHKITYKDLHDMKPPLVDVITKSLHMDFDMDYIAGLREKMGKLVDNLSSVYLDVKKEMAEEKKEYEQLNSRKSLSETKDKVECFPI